MDSGFRDVPVVEILLKKAEGMKHAFLIIYTFD